MATTSSIDLVAKDFDSIVDALITYASVNFGPDTAANRQWTNFNLDDFSRNWLELLAYVGDLVFYYLDVEATQSNLQTATIRSAVLNLATQFGYAVPTATSSSGLAKFSLSSAQTIPLGFKVSSNNGSLFFVASTSLSPGSTALQPLIQVVQGEQKSESFVAKGVQNEEIVLGFSNIVKDPTNIIAYLISPSITVNALPYTLVDTFINSLPTDKHFKLIKDQEGRALIRFGDGIFANKLSPNDSISVNYRIGGGTVGNIPANTLTTLVDSASFITSVDNLSAFSGGADEPTTDALREIVPASLKTLDRAVTLQDYSDIIIANFSNVSKAKSEINEENNSSDINIYVVPSGTSISPITSNPTLVANITSFLDKRKTVTTSFQLKDAFGIDIVIAIEAFLISGASKSEVESNIKAILQAYFDFTTGDTDGRGTKFAQTILLNDIYNLISQVSGIQRFEIKEFNYKPRIDFNVGTGTNYLESPVKIFENSLEYEWLIAPEAATTSPEYIPFSAYKKTQATVTNIGFDSIADESLNFAVIEGTTSGVNSNSTDNIAFDFSKTFLVDQFVGGTSAITITNVSGDTWDHSGSTITPKVGDRITISGNRSFVKEIVDSNTFVLSAGTPAALTNGAGTLNRDSYLFVDAQSNVWTISNNDAHSLVLSAFALNDYTVTDVVDGDYKIVKSLIGSSVIIKSSVFDSIEYNTHNTFYRQTSGFNLVATVGDSFQLSEQQIAQGNFGVPVTAISLVTSSPNPGLATIKFAGNPDLSSVTSGVNSNYVFIDSAKNVFEVYSVDDLNKSVTILHQAGTTTNPVYTNSPGSLAPRYYSDDNDISFVLGISNLSTGIGFASSGSITTIAVASLIDGETFTLDDGINTPTVFEFDSNASVSPGNIAVDISAITTADQVKSAIISAINGVATLGISASNGGTDKVFLQNDQVGTLGNVSITETVVNSGFIVQGMSGGLDAGANSTPIIPGIGSTSNALGEDSNGNVLDYFVFRTPAFVDDITNLRNNEIPEISTADIRLDIRGGVQ